MRNKRKNVILTTIIVAGFLVPAIVWFGMGHAGNDGAIKLPAISTIGPEMNPYVLTNIEREKLLLPVTTQTIPGAPAGVASNTAPTTAQKDPRSGMTQTDRDKLERWVNQPREMQRHEPEKCEAFSTIENVPRAPGIDGLTPGERAKLEAFLKNQNK